MMSDSINFLKSILKFISALQYATNERYDVVGSRFPQEHEQEQVCKISIDCCHIIIGNVLNVESILSYVHLSVA